MYYIAWIFIGNFILLNLFLAILLDSFLGEDDEEEDAEGDELKKKKKILKARRRKAILDSKRVYMNHLFYKTDGMAGLITKKHYKIVLDSEEDLEDLDED